MIIARTIPPKIKFLPVVLLTLTPTPNMMVPIKMQMTADALPMKIRKSQISRKYEDMRFAKSARGLSILRSIILLKVKYDLEHIMQQCRGRAYSL